VQSVGTARKRRVRAERRHSTRARGSRNRTFQRLFGTPAHRVHPKVRGRWFTEGCCLLCCSVAT
jgi:hypothetical protein